MGRTLAAMLACLAVGAGGMWVASNFRVKFEPIGGIVAPQTPPAPPTTDKPEPLSVVASAPPEKLPAHLLPPAKTGTGVQQAGGTLPLAVGVTATAGGVGATQPELDAAKKAIDDNPVEIVELFDGTATDAILYTGADLSTPILLRGNSLILNFRFGNQAELLKQTGNTGAKLKLQILATADGSTKPVVVDVADANATTATIPMTSTEFTGKRKVTLSAQWVDITPPAAPPVGKIPTAFRLSPSRVVTSWDVFLPTGTPPAVPKVLNGRYTETSAVVSNVAQLFPGFARVQVSSDQGGAQHDFLLYGDPAARRTVVASPVVANRRQLSTKVAEYTLTWDAPAGPPKLLVVREKVADRSHQYAAVAVNVNDLPTFPAVTLSNNQLIPVVGGTARGTAAPSAGGVFLLGTNVVNLPVGVSPAAAAADEFGKHGKLLVFVDKQPKDFPAPSVDPLAVSTASPTFSGLDFANDGDHVVHVAVEAGGVIATKLTLNVRVFRGGLAVSRVSPTDFSAATDYRVRVAFSPDRPLDPTTAGTKDNFTLIGDYPNAAEVIVGGPQFDEATNTVTLQVSTPLQAGQYTLSVLGTDVMTGTTVTRKGIRDIYGNPLGGAFGEAGKVFKFTLVQPVGGNLPSVSTGVTLGTGPNVTFPEYTKFRKVPDGFNPSDRVETRVVRLYYTRDAHRVAQIVNRDVKSYNAATVDVRRRAADRARDDANISQDERQRLERAAIAAAGEARAAEGELRQLEAQLASARNEATTARLHLTQREQQLTDARRELARTEGGTTLRANDLVLAQQDRVKDIQDAIGRTQALRTALPAGDPRIADFQRREDELKVDERNAQRELDRLKQSDATTRADRGNDPQRQQVRVLEDEVIKLRQVQATGASVEQALQARIADARSRVQAKRVEEVRTNELALSKDREELRKREEQFRREVAAAKADPDTYAPGLPESDDPVRQCSVSVIGEGLIQIRGPVKGLNVIRTMINQMDAPTGQVRVGVHTVQVNGERADRMDKVVANIQRYLDHSRFLTTQSAQMLRKAVTLVASRKADEAALTLAPGCSRAEQEQKYLHCFFGRDFIEELRQLDSEFLRTGNKLLSLHSMDSTSLSSALFLLALAKNDIRAEILQEWQAQLQTKLPTAELNFYTAGLACPDKCEAHCDKKFCVLSQNAKFESFLGFFNAEVQGNDTLTPVQREFVRLAQIFKTRLVTELELKQRVMERTLLEDRLGDYMKESREAKDREDEAKKALLVVQDKMQTAIVRATTEFASVDIILDEIESSIARVEGPLTLVISDYLRFLGEQPNLDARDRPVVPSTTSYKNRTVQLPVSSPDDPSTVDLAPVSYRWFTDEITLAIGVLEQFIFLSASNENDAKDALDILQTILKTKRLDPFQMHELKKLLPRIQKVLREEAMTARGVIRDIVSELRKSAPNVEGVLQKYTAIRDDILSKLRAGKPMRMKVEPIFGESIGPAFKELQDAQVQVQAAVRRAQLARRSLDEKKLLDMLVDEMEDKYIELLDGTRAHTANVDNYLKALATALDDDFNTQFYAPAFRKIRTLGTGWDVHLGQIESTTVLTNNRVLGKVSPAASMEFDLPRRDILVKEAFKGAKAAVQDYGALLNDPVFLSVVKMYGGMPPSAQFGGAGGGLPAVRNVLPGLPSAADEMILAQGGSPRREFGTNLEALIPDPAIYKFETGTGYEIRPVISPDGQAVVFGFDYMYTTDLREPVRADEKHLGRVKRHFVHTDVQLSNFELREVSKYWVALKAARTGQGVQLLQDIPGVGALFRPAPSAQSSLQQNLIYSQAAIFPTLFDLMGLRYAPAVADIDPEFTKNDEFVVRGRRDYLRQFIFDYGASRVDDALRILYGERRADLYRSQHTIPAVHPNGYQGPGLRQRDSHLQEGYDVREAYPPTKFAPGMHAPLPTDRNGRFDDPLGYPPATPPGSGHTPPGATFGAKPNGSPGREYVAKPLGTTVTREPPPSGYTPLKAAAPTTTPQLPARPSQPTVQAPVGRSAPLPTIPSSPIKADPLEVEPAPISTGQRGYPYRPR